MCGLACVSVRHRCSAGGVPTAPLGASECGATRPRAIVRELTGGDRYAPPCHVAMAFAGLGDAAAMLSWLERAFAEHDPYVAGLAILPAFDPLRADPSGPAAKAADNTARVVRAACGSQTERTHGRLWHSPSPGRFGARGAGDPGALDASAWHGRGARPLGLHRARLRGPPRGRVWRARGRGHTDIC